MKPRVWPKAIFTDRAYEYGLRPNQPRSIPIPGALPQATMSLAFGQNPSRCRPYRASRFVLAFPQGFALGCPMAAFQAETHGKADVRCRKAEVRKKGRCAMWKGRSSER